jgi:major outer sheath protein
MKKFLGILLMSVLVGGAAFAQLEIVPTGSAKLSWGIDLGKGAVDVKHGFYNENKLAVIIPFFRNRQRFSGGSSNKEADVYADLNFSVVPTAKGRIAGERVSAALHFYGAYITVYDKPDFSAGEAIGWEPINVDGGGKDGWFNPEFTGWGTKIGYADKNLMGLDIGLKFASDGNWLGKASDGSTTVAHSQYAMGLDFAMSPVEKYLDISATFNVIFNKAKYATAAGQYGKMMNFGIGLASAPIDGMKIKLGFDGAAVDGFIWDAGLSFGYKWVGAALYFAGKDSEKADGKDFNMDAHLAFTSDEEGDTNFVPGLAFGAVVNAYNLLSKPVAPNTIPLGLKVFASYKATINDSMWIKPYANFYGETNHTNKFDMAYELGVIYSPMEKVEIAAAWNHGELGADTYAGQFEAGKHMIETPLNYGGNNGHNGTFVLSLTLKF